MDLARKRNGLPLTRVDLQGCVDRARFLERNPGGTALHPFLHCGGRVGLLQLSEDSRRYNDPLEEARQQPLSAAQNQVVERRSIGEDDAHEPREIFPSAASSASRSATE